MEASRLLTKKAQLSADNMESMTSEMSEIARKTKQETVLMRIITLITLFFLPGTFISVSTPIIIAERIRVDILLDSHEYRYSFLGRSK